MRIKNLTNSQKKIIIISSISLLVFIIFIIFVFSPAINALRKIKSELLNAENEIKDIESIIKEGRSTDEGIRLIRKKFEELNNKFPPEEEGSFRALSELAKNSNLAVISFDPEPKKPFLDENDKEIVIEGRTLQMIPIALQMKSSFKDLVKFLEGLRKNFATLESIKKLKVSKEGMGNPTLNTTIELNIYLLTKEK